MKALQRVAEEFESWGNRASFLPESRDLFMLYLAFFFAPLLISQQSRGRSLPVSAFHARSDGMHTMITAHSGCEGRPDNSLEYVQYALHCGADALEVDVHPKDDGFYISHDPSDGAHPDLKDVFSLIRGSGVKVNCDLKHPGIEHAVLTLAQACGVDEQLIFSGSVSLEAIRSGAARFGILKVPCLRFMRSARLVFRLQKNRFAPLFPSIDAAACRSSIFITACAHRSALRSCVKTGSSPPCGL